MGLTIYNPVGGPTQFTLHHRNNHHHHHHHHHHDVKQLTAMRKASHIVAAKGGKFTSRTSKFDSKNRRAGTTTKDDEDNVVTQDKAGQRKRMIYDDDDAGVVVEDAAFVDDGFVVPELPGDKPSLWEGPQWDGLGFFVQYMWAFGVVFALVACGIAVATYNEGATDFRETPAYKESVQSQDDVLEEPEASGSDIFESNPTEVAPALE
ncbi:hypothetical protein vseg_013678 [Gypsophila vaccaria]